VSDDVENLGREDVRGVSTTHYRASFDLEQVYRSAGAVTDEDAFAELLEQYRSTVMTTEAWVDDDGLVRRTVTSIPLADGTQEVKAEFFDFGVKVDSSVPSDDETFDFGDIDALEGK
jgi:hypothetical protein